MAIVIAVIENHKNKEIDSLCADYLKKLTGTYATKLEILPAARVTDPAQQKAKETETILKLCKPGDKLVLCDEHGKQLLHDVKEHGKHYNQDSIFHHDTKSAKLHGTNATGFPGKGKEEDVGKTKFNKPHAPFQTETKPKSDKPLKAGRTSRGSARFTTE